MTESILQTYLNEQHIKTDVTENIENLKKAVDSQYNGVDTENELMWILKD